MQGRGVFAPAVIGIVYHVNCNASAVVDVVDAVSAERSGLGCVAVTATGTGAGAITDGFTPSAIGSIDDEKVDDFLRDVGVMYRSQRSYQPLYTAWTHEGLHLCAQACMHACMCVYAYTYIYICINIHRYIDT